MFKKNKCVHNKIGRFIMTQKELLYIEDAIGHEQNIISIISDTINNLEDNKLVSFMKNEYKYQTNVLEKLIKKLKICANE